MMTLHTYDPVARSASPCRPPTAPARGCGFAALAIALILPVFAAASESAEAVAPASVEVAPTVGVEVAPTVGVEVAPAMANLAGVGRDASDQGGMWMTAALNVRLLAESEQLRLLEGETPEVEAVAALICDVHESRPRCGSQCTSTRRDRRHVPDYSDFVVEPVICWDVARVLVAAAHDYEVPLDELLATAYQESRFRPVALGSGSECGLFQQATHHIRYASANVEHMGRVPHGDRIDVCTYLLRPENAAWHFALKYHHEVAQSGRNWSAYYNGGHDMWGYQDRHESYRARFGAFLEDYQETHGATFTVE